MDIINPGNLVLPRVPLRLQPIFGDYDCRYETTNVLLVRNDIVVRTTAPQDWSYINKLAKENSSSIGFLPSRTWHQYVWGGERNFVCFLCLVNNEPCGFALVTPGYENRPVRVQQIVIQEDLRRLEYGMALIDVVEDFRKQFNRTGIILRCRSDLIANLFWDALGFTLVGIQERGTTNHMGFKASLDINMYERIDDRQVVDVQ
jgi:GNAT superfamily N-acetyltransferase